jgi:hypothetical protein
MGLEIPLWSEGADVKLPSMVVRKDVAAALPAATHSPVQFIKSGCQPSIDAFIHSTIQVLYVNHLNTISIQVAATPYFRAEC